MTLIACIKNQGEISYRVMPLVPDVINDVKDVMISNIKLFLDTGLEIIDYEPGYSLEENQVFRIYNKNIADDVYEAFKNTAILDRLQGDDIENLNICGVFGQYEIDGKTMIVGQSLSSAYSLQRASGFSLLLHEDSNYVRFTSRGVTLRRTTDIVVLGDEIRFLTYQAAARLFSLTEHFEAATDAVLERFIDPKIFIVDDLVGFKSNADSWVRRKVALIMRRDVLNRVSIEDIQDVAEREQVDISFSGNEVATRIVIPNERAKLKALLRFLDEDLFYGALTKDPFITNSKRKRS